MASDQQNEFHWVDLETQSDDSRFVAESLRDPYYLFGLLLWVVGFAGLLAVPESNGYALGYVVATSWIVAAHALNEVFT